MAVLAALIVLLLVSADDDAPDEARGDLTYIEGSMQEPREEQGAQVASIADVVTAEVRAQDGEIVFESEMAAAIPQQLDPGALELRWQLRDDQGATWTVSATLAERLDAAIYSSSGYGSGTVDDSMPGSVSLSGSTVSISVRPTEIEAFPDSFEWRLETTLRAFAGEADPPRVEDQMPDDGYATFDG